MNNRVILVIIALVIGGTLVIGLIPGNPAPPPSSVPNTQLNSPTFSRIYNLPSLIGMAIWPTATPSPIPPPTTTPIPTGGPQPTTDPITGGNCSWMDTGLPNVKEYYPNGGPAMPATTKEVCAFNGTSYYSLPFRNADCQAAQTGITNAYNKMKTYYPAYWQTTKLLQDWKTVQQYAIKYNFNPLFLISLWIEESAAGGATQATKLGCDYRRNRDNTYTKMAANSSICEQMECHFGLQSAYPGNYALWACNYRYGANYWVNNKCQDAIGFTKGIEFWYNYISGGNLPAGCKIQYFPGADSRCPSK